MPRVGLRIALPSTMLLFDEFEDVFVERQRRMQKIAAAFREAQEDGAVLVFDEVDSLLRDRRGAQHS